MRVGLFRMAVTRGNWNHPISPRWLMQGRRFWRTYAETTAEDLTLYEWWITPHRIDGLPFHEFMMASNAERGTVFGAEGKAKSPTRFDLSNLHLQRYGDTAIASYTLLISTATPD